MSFTSFSFLLFITVVFALYFILPKKAQWWVLLAASLLFYWKCSQKMIVFIIFTTATVYVAARWLQKIHEDGAARAKVAANREEQTAIRVKTTRNKRWVMTGVLLANFGILAATKYAMVFDGLLKTVTAIVGMEPLSFPQIAMPLGVSFYTFQTAGYMIDVYRGKQKAEKNPLKLLLFTSFFPQIMQGPISRYNQLAPQLYEGHSFDFEQAKRGIVRIGWGFVKKLVLADRLYVLVDALFANYSEYGGAMMFLASILYGFHIYTDFSSGIDITLGAAQVMGITMTPNFKQPYFATSLSDFWRRWHITLGGWMRDYIFFPVTMSKPAGKLGKWIRQKFGARWTKVVISGLGSFIVFTIVGIWHGPEMKYTVYGLYNGALIMLGTMFEPWFATWSEKLHINRESKGWHAVQLLRTFVLVHIGRCIVRSLSVRPALHAFKQMVINPAFGQLGQIMNLGLTQNDFIIVIVLLVLVFIVDVIAEKHGCAMDWLQKRPLPVRWLVYFGIIFMLMMLTPIADIGGDFAYAKF